MYTVGSVLLIHIDYVHIHVQDPEGVCVMPFWLKINDSVLLSPFFPLSKDCVNIHLPFDFLSCSRWYLECIVALHKLLFYLISSYHFLGFACLFFFLHFLKNLCIFKFIHLLISFHPSSLSLYITCCFSCLSL